MAEFQREGEITFDTETTDEDTSADSPSEDDNQGGDTHSTDGDNSQPQDKTPFDQHPRWKEREDDWTRRFNDQEVRHQNDIKSIREEFGTARKENAEATQIPAWFGGDQKQWDAYRADRDAELKSAAKAAVDALKGERNTEENAVQEATTYLRSEVAAIEADKTLNPSGAKIDQEKLFKTVFDNQLVDTKGRWNYRAGYRLMMATAPAAVTPKPTPQGQARKEAAAATSESGGGAEAGGKKDYMTSDDFKSDRPW